MTIHRRNLRGHRKRGQSAAHWCYAFGRDAVASIHKGKSRKNPYEVHWREDGRKRTKSWPTREDAENHRREVEARHTPTVATLKKNLTFQQYAPAWLLYAERDLGLQRTTLRRYENELKYTIIPWAKKHRWTVANVTRHDIQQLLRARRKEVSKETAAKTATVIFSMMRDAVVNNLRYDDPTSGMSARQGRAGRAPRKSGAVDPPTLAVVNSVIEALASKPRVQTWAATIVYTGARPSEAVSVGYGHIDWTRRLVRLVEQPYVEVGGKMWPKELDEGGKTPAARRTVPLVDQLEPYLRRAEEWRDDRQPHLVFPSRWTEHAQAHGGVPMSIEHARRTMTRLCRAAGVVELSPYDLRHFYAAAAIASGEDQYTVKTVMGHEKISTTLDLYGHLWETDLDDLRTSLTSLFGTTLEAARAR